MLMMGFKPTSPTLYQLYYGAPQRECLEIQKTNYIYSAGQGLIYTCRLLKFSRPVIEVIELYFMLKSTVHKIY